MDDKSKPPHGAFPPLSLAAASTPTDLEKSIAIVERQWPQEIELARIISKSMRIKFDALKKEGFTDQQSLHAACKWMWPGSLP